LPLCHGVGTIGFRGALHDVDFPVTPIMVVLGRAVLGTMDIFPEMMPALTEVTSAVGDILLGGQSVGAGVIFKERRPDGGASRSESKLGTEFFDHVLEAKEDGHGAGQLHVFGLEGRQSDARKQGTFPNEWNAAEVDDVAATRASTGRVFRCLRPPEAGEVGITVGVEVEGAIEVDDEPFGLRLLKVAKNGLDRSCMALFRIAVEAGRTGNGVGDVRSAVGS